MEINGLNALQFDITGSIEQVNLHYFVTLIEAAENFHQVICWTLKTRYERYIEEYRKIAASFKILS